MHTRVSGNGANSVSAEGGRAPPDRAFESAQARCLNRYGKRADLVVHEQEPLNAETNLAALAEGPLTATEAF